MWSSNDIFKFSAWADFGLRICFNNLKWILSGIISIDWCWISAFWCAESVLPFCCSCNSLHLNHESIICCFSKLDMVILFVGFYLKPMRVKLVSRIILIVIEQKQLSANELLYCCAGYSSWACCYPGFHSEICTCSGK